MQTYNGSIVVADADLAFCDAFAYALSALAPHTSVHMAHTAPGALAMLLSAQPAPFLLFASVELATHGKSPNLLEAANAQHPRVVKVMLSGAPSTEVRQPILDAYLRAGLFAYAEKSWVYECLGYLLDAAHHRHMGRPGAGPVRNARFARLWTAD